LGKEVQAQVKAGERRRTRGGGSPFMAVARGPGETKRKIERYAGSEREWCGFAPCGPENMRRKMMGKRRGNRLVANRGGGLKAH